MKIRLQERDKMLFQYLLKYKVASLYQIQKHLHIVCRRHTLQERLKQLAKKGYLQSTYFDRKKVYGLGAKGQDWLYKNALILKKFKLPHLGFSDTKLNHDILLNDVIHKLELVKSVTDILTHNEKLLQPSPQEDLQRIPDATFTMKKDTAEIRMALELEISQKGKSRYWAIMDTYLRDPGIALVLYLVPITLMKSALTKIAEKYLKLYDDKIYFGLVDHFLKSPQDCLFASASGRTFKLCNFSEIVRRKSTKQTPDTTPDSMSEVA